MQKPSLILTGATGLIGSRFVELYSDQFEIHNLDLATGVDITSAEQVEAFIASHPATTLIHLAAFTDTARAESEAGNKEGICYRVNVIGAENIANSCRDHNIFMIHVSTDFVFDGTKTEPYVESDPRFPASWYGTTKALAEEAVEKSGVKYAIARLSYPYRANFDQKPDLIKKIREALSTHTLTPRFSDNLITPTFVDDIARGFARLATLQPEGIYHLVGTGSISPYDLAREVAIAYGLDPNEVLESTLADYQKNHGSSFVKNGAMSNVMTKKVLDIEMVDLKTGLGLIKAQQK
ncbi:NAD(P)-dependent oxidoreductase [Candidatus Woesebacteria bacterium]|nr:NAD(P)-dependent oxidoreductase [Candidatus Woesebacteria bacterium]